MQTRGPGQYSHIRVVPQRESSRASKYNQSSDEDSESLASSSSQHLGYDPPIGRNLQPAYSGNPGTSTRRNSRATFTTAGVAERRALRTRAALNSSLSTELESGDSHTQAEMPKKRAWRKLNLSELPEPDLDSPATEISHQRSESDAPNSHRVRADYDYDHDVREVSPQRLKMRRIIHGLRKSPERQQSGTPSTYDTVSEQSDHPTKDREGGDEASDPAYSVGMSRGVEDQMGDSTGTPPDLGLQHQLLMTSMNIESKRLEDEPVEMPRGVIPEHAAARFGNSIDMIPTGPPHGSIGQSIASFGPPPGLGHSQLTARPSEYYPVVKGTNAKPTKYDPHREFYPAQQSISSIGRRLSEGHGVKQDILEEHTTRTSAHQRDFRPEEMEDRFDSAYPAASREHPSDVPPPIDRYAPIPSTAFPGQETHMQSPQRLSYVGQPGVWRNFPSDQPTLDTKAARQTAKQELAEVRAREAASNADWEASKFSDDKANATSAPGPPKDDDDEAIVDTLLIPALMELTRYVRGHQNFRYDHFNRMVARPEWAIDRSPNANNSFFEPSWGFPPRRRARDPRYARGSQYGFS